MTAWRSWSFTSCVTRWSSIPTAETCQIGDSKISTIDICIANGLACGSKLVSLNRMVCELFFAPTTEHRRYYEGLPADPLASAWDENEMPVSDGAVELAHAAFERSQNAPMGGSAHERPARDENARRRHRVRLERHHLVTLVGA
jgi:hypothetical protein